jgi:hypothetical protein
MAVLCHPGGTAIDRADLWQVRAVPARSGPGPRYATAWSKVTPDRFAARWISPRLRLRRSGPAPRRLMRGHVPTTIEAASRASVRARVGFVRRRVLTRPRRRRWFNGYRPSSHAKIARTRAAVRGRQASARYRAAKQSGDVSASWPPGVFLGPGHSRCRPHPSLCSLKPPTRVLAHAHGHGMSRDLLGNREPPLLASTRRTRVPECTAGARVPTRRRTCLRDGRGVPRLGQVRGTKLFTRPGAVG